MYASPIYEHADTSSMHMGHSFWSVLIIIQPSPLPFSFPLPLQHVADSYDESFEELTLDVEGVSSNDIIGI